MESQEEGKKRIKKGIAVSAAGVCFNLILGGVKIAGGLLTGSVAFITDAVNNLSDSLSSVITGVSFALSGRKADREHPYGHGRYDYVAGLIVGLLIVFAGLQFIIESVGRIISPSLPDFSVVWLLIFVAFVLAKIGMSVFYRRFGARLNSDSLKAASVDSICDSLVTLVVAAAFTVSYFFPEIPFSVDGVCGVLVSVFIIVSGVRVVLSTVNKLLGNGCDLVLSDEVYALVCSHPLVIGAHDLLLHDYGPSIRIGSVHAEFDCNMTIMEAHKIIDGLEKRALDEMGIDLVIHVDPIDVSDPSLSRLRSNLKIALKLYNSSVHELNIDNENKAISFHVKLPSRYEKISGQAVSTLSAAAAKGFDDYAVKVEVDIIK